VSGEQSVANGKKSLAKHCQPLTTYHSPLTKMPQTFRDLIAANRRSSFLLVVMFCLFTVVAALVLGLGIIAYCAPDAVSAINWGEGLVIGGIAAGVAFLISLISYYQGDKLILGISGARQIEHKDDPEFFNVVEEMAIAAGIPMPKVYLIDDPAPNALATGRDPRHAAVAITTGLRSKLTRDELQGVMAHEISHIRNYDIRLMLLLAVLIGTIVMLADFFWQLLRFSGSGGRRTKSDGKGGGLVVLVLFLIAILLAIIAPILAQIIQLAVSRQREYLADASGVELTRYPQGLVNALRKIDADPHDLKHANRGTAHLYIANPIKKFEARAHTMFASHPPIKDRIARLEALTH
jgi:heat shock protein HtpX